MNDRELMKDIRERGLWRTAINAQEEALFNVLYEMDHDYPDYTQEKAYELRTAILEPYRRSKND